MAVTHPELLIEVRSCLGRYLQVQKYSDKLCLCALYCCVRELWWGQGLQQVTVSSGDKHSKLSLGVAWVSVLRIALPIACSCCLVHVVCQQFCMSAAHVPHAEMCIATCALEGDGV